jgi:hypothetical protein
LACFSLDLLQSLLKSVNHSCVKRGSGIFIPKIIEGSRTETPKAEDINRTAIRSSSNLHNAFQRRPDKIRTGSVNRGPSRLLTREKSGQLSRWLTLVEMEVIDSPISREADPTRLGGLH